MTQAVFSPVRLVCPHRVGLGSMRAAANRIRRQIDGTMFSRFALQRALAWQQKRLESSSSRPQRHCHAGGARKSRAPTKVGAPVAKRNLAVLTVRTHCTKILAAYVAHGRLCHTSGQRMIQRSAVAFTQTIVSHVLFRRWSRCGGRGHGGAGGASSRDERG